MEGIVKWFNRKKGYGFIKGDDEQEYFVHYTAVQKGVFLKDDDRVSFEPAETDKGKQAQNVALLQKGSEIAKDNSEEQSEESGEEQEEDIQPLPEDDSDIQEE